MRSTLFSHLLLFSNREFRNENGNGISVGDWTRTVDVWMVEHVEFLIGIFGVIIIPATGSVDFELEPVGTRIKISNQKLFSNQIN